MLPFSQVKEALQTALAQAEPQETLDYYLARPALAQYTLQTELPRMVLAELPSRGPHPAPLWKRVRAGPVVSVRRTF